LQQKKIYCHLCQQNQYVSANMTFLARWAVLIRMNTIPVKAKTTDIKEDVSFNLPRMKEAVEASSHLLPTGLNFTEFENWINDHQPEASPVH
jgi:hypothetical protein